MNIVSFEEVRDIFDMGSVWMDGREEYWFQKAWQILEEEQMTCYSNAYEEKTVHLYALVLVAVYLEFCKITWDEDSTERILLDIEEFFSAVEIGQLLRQYLKPGELISDMEEAVNEIVFHLQCRLFRSMMKHLSVSEIFAWMYCTSFTPYLAEEEEYDITSFQEYEKMIRESLGDILDAAANEGLPIDGFDYICRLT